MKLTQLSLPLSNRGASFSKKAAILFAPRSNQAGGSRWPGLALVILVVVLLGLTGATALAQSEPSQIPESTFEAIDAYIVAEMAATNIPGLALAVVQGDEIVYQQGYGVADSSGRPLTPQVPLNIGSLSKSFTALAIMQLVEAGEIELDAPVQDYLPWFRVADPAASMRMTVLDLLSHTSGIPQAAGNDYQAKHDSGSDALENRVRALSSTPLLYPVGERWEYSNANYDILGLIVQTVSGEDYPAYIQSHIFDPLEMDHTYTSRDAAVRDDEPATGHRLWFGWPVSYSESSPLPHLPSGHQFSTSEDLAHLLIAHLNGGRYHDAAVLSAEGIETMHNSAVPSGPGCATYSMHWSHATSCESATLSMGGDTANFKARVLMSPEEQRAIVLLMNAQSVGINGPRIDRIKDGVFNLLAGQPPPGAGSDHNMPILAALVLVVLVTIVFAILLVWSLILLRRQSPTPDLAMSGRPWKDMVIVFVAGLWLLFLFGMIQFAAGSFSTRPLSFMLENVPDLGWLIVLSALMTISLIVARSLLIGRRLQKGSAPITGADAPLA